MVNTNPYQVTLDFEERIADYTGAPYVVSIDNCTNALFLCMKYLKIVDKTITIPNRTFMSVPCAIINAGNKVNFDKNHKAVIGNKLRGQYKLEPFPIWDSALTFTKDMYIPNQLMCLSFSGPHKTLKIGKGGAILTDNEKAYKWFKKAAYFGRNPIDHLVDDFDMIGWNYYLLPELASRGNILMLGLQEHNDDLEIEYQDLSKFKIYKEKNK